MYTVPRKTRRLGKNLIFRPEVASTNSLASTFAKSGEISDGTVVVTLHQSAGRGQAGSTWHTEPGRNLTMSVYLEKPVNAADAFMLNIVSTLAVADLCKSCGLNDIRVKWPNDVLVDCRKISGILCENSIQGETIRWSVVGIGLNINQTRFDGFNATSLSLQTEREFDLNAILEELLFCFESRLDQLRDGFRNQLRTTWTSLLYLHRTQHIFNTPAGPLKGMITGIDEVGRLIVETATGPRIFGPKEISFL